MSVVPLLLVQMIWIAGEDDAEDVLVMVDEDSVTLKPYASENEQYLSFSREEWEQLVKFVDERFEWLDKPVMVGGRD